jgi:hypothetical protein
VLATAEGDLPERHRSVGAILESTLAALSAEERELAQTLAEAPADVEESASPADLPSGDMLSGLRVLSDQALVSIDNSCGAARLNPLLSRYVRSRRHRGRRAAPAVQYARVD